MTASRTIELIAPSGYPQDPRTVERGVERLRAEGNLVVGEAAARRRYLRFAGTDGERAAELNRLADPSRALPDIVLAVRGGYGAVRLLHGLDYDGLARRLRDRPVALVGHSDFTALQLALLARAALVTFGGPMLTTDFGAETLNEFTLHHFWHTLTHPSLTLEVAVPQTHSLDVSGTLWGGNLSVLSALVGTPYMPPVEGGILFLEDVNEQPFRLERMLYQLHLSGILERQQALVLGDFTAGKPFDYDNGYNVATMIEQMREVTGMPILTGLPFGHVPSMATLPVGAPARLTTHASGFRLSVSGYPCIG